MQKESYDFIVCMILLYGSFIAGFEDQFDSRSDAYRHHFCYQMGYSQLLLYDVRSNMH